ncbi:efflux RND transporter periplasmic adaptor subunit [Derxia gummosa]|uniref:Efflux RND transporter periplasmic adaptor subunit n=1 Tax=Derxia gummosa DSM 723 TaxID=1121388 RepID=A0A8B6XB71_9BURK|nr:efflux RND transporter periplasmic adaptor subunit [Derxia gummosa]
MNTTLFRTSLIALSLAAALAGCGKDASTEAAAGTEQAAAAPSDPNLVTAPPALAGQLKTVTVGKTAVAEPLHVVGRIDFDEQRVARIGANVTGRVTELMALPGQQVAAGAVLAQLNSAELGTAQLALLKARAQRELAAKAVERARLLLAADVIGSAELQRRENELGVAQVEERAATDALRVMGVSQAAIGQTANTGAITSISSIVSTLSGVVVERKVNKGQVVQPAEVLFTVADLSRVWVVAQVPEAQVGRVAVGQNVNVDVPSNGVEPITGKIVWVADIVNPETRTVMVRTEVDNPKRHLKPAMLANLVIEPLPVERLVVPAAAVVREENEDYVFVRTEGDKYRRTPVKLADAVGGVRPVETGLVGGEVIVGEGAFHLNNQRKQEAEGGQ